MCKDVFIYFFIFCTGLSRKWFCNNASSETFTEALTMWSPRSCWGYFVLFHWLLEHSLSPHTHTGLIKVHSLFMHSSAKLLSGNIYTWHFWRKYEWCLPVQILPPQCQCVVSGLKGVALQLLRCSGWSKLFFKGFFYS